MASFAEFLKSLDADRGKRGKQFEYFIKWFLKNDPEWTTQVDKGNLEQYSLSAISVLAEWAVAALVPR